MKPPYMHQLSVHGELPHDQRLRGFGSESRVMLCLPSGDPGHLPALALEAAEAPLLLPLLVTFTSPPSRRGRGLLPGAGDRPGRRAGRRRRSGPDPAQQAEQAAQFLVGCHESPRGRRGLVLAREHRPSGVGGGRGGRAERARGLQIMKPRGSSCRSAASSWSSPARTAVRSASISGSSSGSGAESA